MSNQSTPSPSASASGFDAPPAGTFRSKLATIVGTLLTVLLLGTCALCGAGLYFFQPDVSEEPTAVAPLTARMISVDVPAAFEPRGTIEWDFFWLVLMRGTYYQLTGAEGMLMFLEVDSRVMDEPDVREHVERTLREKGGGGPPLTIIESREEQYYIRGQNVTFLYRVGESPDDHTKHHLVEGVVSGNTGPVLVAFRVAEESWMEIEPLVEATIRSIR
jgi:hypothetical protein